MKTYMLSDIYQVLRHTYVHTYEDIHVIRCLLTTGAPAAAQTILATGGLRGGGVVEVILTMSDCVYSSLSDINKGVLCQAPYTPLPLLPRT